MTKRMPKSTKHPHTLSRHGRTDRKVSTVRLSANLELSFETLSRITLRHPDTSKKVSPTPSKAPQPHSWIRRVLFYLILLVLAFPTLQASIHFVDWILPLLGSSLLREQAAILYDYSLNLILEIIRIILTAILRHMQ